MEAKRRGLQVEFVLSGDGSHTLFVPAMNEHYHSVFGAINESRHIFINAGYHAVNKSAGNIRILEIGFGTGLNALLTYFESMSEGIAVDYVSIEKNPLAETLYSQLNYPEIIPLPGCREIFMALHASGWKVPVKISEKFSLHKIDIALEDFIPENETFDLVYFDAFNPVVQPEMWTPEVFRKMAEALKPGGILVTYSTRGIVKRSLKETGFALEKLPGPAGKREILRAVRL